jgi:hypothetical protein
MFALPTAGSVLQIDTATRDEMRKRCTRSIIGRRQGRSSFWALGQPNVALCH